MNRRSLIAAGATTMLLCLAGLRWLTSDERDVIQLRVQGHEWTAEPDPAFALATTGTLTIGTSGAFVIEDSLARDLLTISGRAGVGGVDFMGGPCDGWSLCFRGTWRYHQPSGAVITIGHVDSSGVFHARRR